MLKSSGGESSINFPLHAIIASKAIVSVQCKLRDVIIILIPCLVMGTAIFCSLITLLSFCLNWLISNCYSFIELMSPSYWSSFLPSTNLEKMFSTLYSRIKTYMYVESVNFYLLCSLTNSCCCRFSSRTSFLIYLNLLVS